MPSLHSGLMVGAPGSITAFLIGFITPCMLYATYRTYIANSAVCEKRMKAGRQGRTSRKIRSERINGSVGGGGLQKRRMAGKGQHRRISSYTWLVVRLTKLVEWHPMMRS